MVAAYNLVHVVDTIRQTPAMALGLTDRPWTVAELVTEAMRFEPISTEPTPPPAPEPKRGRGPDGRSIHDPRLRRGEPKPGFQLRVIRGGRS